MNTQTSHIIEHIKKAMIQNTEEIKGEIFELRREMNMRFDSLNKTSKNKSESMSPLSNRRNGNSLQNIHGQDQLMVNPQMNEIMKQMTVFASLPNVLDRITQQLVIDKKKNDADRDQNMEELGKLSRQTQDALKSFKKATEELERLRCNIYNPKTYKVCLIKILYFIGKILYNIHSAIHLMLQLPICPFLSVQTCICIAYILELYLLLLLTDTTKGYVFGNKDYDLTLSNMFIRFSLGSIAKLSRAIFNSKKDFVLKVSKNIWKTTNEATGIGGLVLYAKNETFVAIKGVQDTFRDSVYEKINEGYDRALAIPTNAISSLGSIASSTVDTAAGALGAAGTGVIGAVDTAAGALGAAGTGVIGAVGSAAGALGAAGTGVIGAVGSAAGALGAAGTGVIGAATNITKRTASKAANIAQGTRKLFGKGGGKSLNNFNNTPVSNELIKLKKKIEKINLNPRQNPGINSLPFVIKLLEMFVPYFTNEINESIKFTKYNMNCAVFNIDLARATINILI
jgi:hypothetical protein